MHIHAYRPRHLHRTGASRGGIPKDTSLRPPTGCYTVSNSLRRAYTYDHSSLELGETGNEFKTSKKGPEAQLQTTRPRFACREGQNVATLFATRPLPGNALFRPHVVVADSTNVIYGGRREQILCGYRVLVRSLDGTRRQHFPDRYPVT